MSISLKGVEGGGTLYFPYLPEKVKVTHGTNYRTYDIIELGGVRVPQGRDCVKVSWEGYFFGEARRTMDYLGAWAPSDECINQIIGWQEDGAHLVLMITEAGLNLDVTVSKFTPQDEGGLGDVKYNIEFTEYRELKMYTESSIGAMSYKKLRTRIRHSPGSFQARPTAGSSYSIRSGDTLWGIARLGYGDGSRWPDLYAANAATLEKAASQGGYTDSSHGERLVPGTQILIP